MYFTDHAKQAAAEVLDACRNPPSLIDHLARLVSRKRRPGVVSDGWSFRNQLIVMLRGHSEARGYKPWEVVGRRVRPGEKAFYIMAPLLKARPEADQPARRAKKGGQDTTGPAKVVIGYRAVPVFGLEQTQPVEAWTEEKKYHPFGESEEYVRVFAGYGQPWYRWYEQMLPGTPDQLTALLAAAIVAKVFDEPTELQDLLNQLAKHPVEEVAERIDRSCRAVADYLESEAGSAGPNPLARQ